jgi:hypothetical protein
MILMPSHLSPVNMTDNSTAMYPYSLKSIKKNIHIMESKSLSQIMLSPIASQETFTVFDSSMIHQRVMTRDYSKLTFNFQRPGKYFIRRDSTKETMTIDVDEVDGDFETLVFSALNGEVELTMP